MMDDDLVVLFFLTVTLLWFTRFDDRKGCTWDEMRQLEIDTNRYGIVHSVFLCPQVICSSHTGRKRFPVHHMQQIS
jgi:hypothetical protein